MDHNHLGRVDSRGHAQPTRTDGVALAPTAQTMANVIPDSQIRGHERFVDVVELPEPDDRHVVAAAIAGHADAIVTFNLKGFPAKVLEPLGIEVQHPDDFVVNQLHLNLTDALKAVKALRLRSIRPPQKPGRHHQDPHALRPATNRRPAGRPLRADLIVLSFRRQGCASMAPV